MTYQINQKLKRKYCLWGMKCKYYMFDGWKDIMKKKMIPIIWMMVHGSCFR